MRHKITLITSLVFIFTSYSFAQKTSKATGEWVLERIEQNDTTKTVSQIVDFNQDGNLYIQEIPFGKWNSKKENQLLIFDAKDISGNYTVTYKGLKKMQLSLADKQLYFSKINRSTITKNNIKSGLIGTWVLDKKQDNNSKIFLTFKAGDTLTIFEKGNGFKSKSAGMWIFNPEEKSLLLIGQIEELRGLNKIITLTNNNFSIENKAKVFNLKKVVQDASKIERLSFTGEDFYNDNGEYKYNNDFEKLPWRDSYQMISSLSKIKYLVYQFSTLIESTKSFETKTLTANVRADEEMQTLSIDYIFNGYDRYNLPEDTALKPNDLDNYFTLFPYEKASFRVTGEEEITTAAGRFTCITVELIGDFEERIKLYMIKDKPGIIAKIIKDKPGRFGYYNMYQLKEIK